MDDFFLDNAFWEEMQEFGIEETPENTEDEVFEPDNCAKALSDDAEEPHDPVPLSNTWLLRKHLVGQNIATKVCSVLKAMDDVNINLPLFLDALSWGDPACHADPKIQYACTALMVSDELPGILEWWYSPPRSQKQRKGKRPAGAQQVLSGFATKCTVDCIDREMKISASLFLSPSEELSEEHLINLDFANMKAKVKAPAPIFWEILHRAAYTPQQEAWNKHKDPNMVRPTFLSIGYFNWFNHKSTLNQISQCQYSCSHRHGHLPKIWAIYL
jgi:hypothetical protein